MYRSIWSCFGVFYRSKYTHKWSKMVHKSLKKWQKPKKLFILGPERPRTVLNVFWECMYFRNLQKCGESFKNNRQFLTDTFECQKFWYIFDNILKMLKFLNFVKIFGKFCKNFGLLETRVIIPDFFRTSKYRETQNTGKVERPKIFRKRSTLTWTS